MKFTLRKFGTRPVFVLVLLAYVAVFNWAYRDLVAPTYAYYGLGWDPPPAIYALVAWLLCVLPALWMPIGLTRPSQLLLLVLYLVIYIPPMFVMYHSNLPEIPNGEVLAVSVVMFGGLGVVRWISGWPAAHVKYSPLAVTTFSALFGLFALALVGYLFLTARQQARFTLDFSMIYVFRTELADRITGEGGGFMGYAVTWLSGFVLPFCFALGSIGRSRKLALAGLIGPFFLYLVTWHKAFLFAPFFFLLVYLLVSRMREAFATVLALSLLVLLLVGLLLLPLNADWAIRYTQLTGFRTFSVPALILGQYYDFFAYHQHTYLSHVRGISWLIKYPYDVILSTLIPNYYYGPEGSGANAGMWTQDGVAAFGLPGILLISILCGGLFRLFDSLAQAYDIRFTTLTISFIVVNFTSTSLFTTLLSGGLGLLMLSLWVLPRAGIFRRVLRMRASEPAADKGAVTRLAYGL